ncbi:type II toxin-antitoxin system RelE/ParE family toxin [Arenibacter sp. GZD96]|uniref:type II toxin-antitoxin system RelE/ParE family toxin n=1 Tax=Aurantibrevibacter litoralis TaxID=3106030 RepID=UPI002AFEDF68|nr:type II toxin-antitoxin system RelE/ParE family toxin [Arenibacter sp. GZD-96]MEA1785169.1 type II toxin-antitoxin system RelE/ParE family toxin [Arenibacter sp. GZD-96]
MKKLLLTSRTLDDLQEIYEYSAAEWGEQTALKYMPCIEDCFKLLQENEGLLKPNKNISSRFVVYPVQKHYLVCDIIKDAICILTVRHTSMNLLERLKKLEPTLDEEAKALYKKSIN